MTLIEHDVDVVVIGAGPGGYAAGIRCAQKGLSTVVVGSIAGGTCLNFGCIPSKALIEVAHQFEVVDRAASGTTPFGISAAAPAIDLGTAIEWKDGVVDRLTTGVVSLLSAAGARLLTGWATVLDGKTIEVATEAGVEHLRTKNLVLASGSTPIELPTLPFDDLVVSSTEMLSSTTVPDDLVVVGGGYIGLELGTAMAKLGAKVCIVEATERVLAGFDPVLTAPVAKRLDELGVRTFTRTIARGMNPSRTALVVEGSDGTFTELAADRVLVTVGRQPLTTGWGLEVLDLDRHGAFVKTDDQCRTSMAGVFAIGDLTGEPMLAHRATAQAEIVAEVIAGGSDRWDHVCIPSVVYTDPEIVTVGLSRTAAKDAGHDVTEARFPFSANGRALSAGDPTGFIQVVARRGDGLVLGLHAVGAGVSELSSAFSLALEMGSCLEDIAGTIHSHPTRSEALQEAALVALGTPLHLATAGGRGTI